MKEIGKHLVKTPKKNSKRQRVVVITQGANETIVVSGSPHSPEAPEVQIFSVPKINADEIVDSNGAGDAFAGGFMAKLVEGESLTTMVNSGHWLAQLSLRQLGAQFPLPKQTFTE